MARWRLTEPHYLTVPGTEWEYSETDRTTGRMVRQRFPVPLLLDPKSPADQNYRADEAIIVCVPGKGLARDYPFIGPPTPSMEPLDEEAEAISAEHRDTWAKTNPIDNFGLGGSFAESLLAGLTKQIEALQVTLSRTPAGMAPAPTSSTEVQTLLDANAALQAQLADMAERLSALEGAKVAPKPAMRRV